MAFLVLHFLLLGREGIRVSSQRGTQEMKSFKGLQSLAKRPGGRISSLGPVSLKLELPNQGIREWGRNSGINARSLIAAAPDGESLVVQREQIHHKAPDPRKALLGGICGSWHHLVLPMD